MKVGEPRIGSLFSGAGGLDLAVLRTFGGRIEWHCEVDPAAATVLRHHWPRVPNFGDVTEIHWDSYYFSVEPVDILCGGYPCQPFSAAGQRKGTDDERHLWPYFAEAIRRIRPRYVVLENVAGHRSMGFDSVLGDLASMWYDAQWCSVRASDVGAPHRRERLFIVATPTDADDGAGNREWARPQSRQGSEDASNAAFQSGSFGDGDDVCAGSSARRQPSDSGRSGDADAVALLPTPAACRSGNNQSPSPGAAVRPSLDSITELLPTPTASDAARGDCPSERERRSPGLVSVDHYLPTPNASDGTGGGQHPDRREGHSRQLIDYVLAPERWGKYAPAIRRWEQATRPAPSPTEPNSKGNPRLAAAFSEWMMGWPAGWVTEVPGISRNDQLRIVGNGVCPQQASAALSHLIEVSRVAA